MAQPKYDYDAADFDVPEPYAQVVEKAERGKVIYLHTHKRAKSKAMLMPTELAEAALEALEDAQDVAAMRSAEGDSRRPFEDVARELGI